MIQLFKQKIVVLMDIVWDTALREPASESNIYEILLKGVFYY